MRAERISPNYRRITFQGVDNMGPETIRDLRIKLIFPDSAGLPDLPPDPSWRKVWGGLPADERGVMRTYSIRALRRPQAAGPDGTPVPAEMDIDFVLHTTDPGPAASWAETASVGDTLILVAPTVDAADPWLGIEFAPGDSEEAVLFGDETALPAIAKILSEWPDNLRGEAYVEIPEAADAQNLEVPDGVTVHWLPRAEGGAGAVDAVGELLHAALVERLGSTQRNGEGGAGEADAAEARGASTGSPDNDSLPIWETPTFSSSGEDVSRMPGDRGDVGKRGDARTYYWIAGESGAVTRMRRLLVREWGVPRARVSFMGYWKRGVRAAG